MDVPGLCVECGRPALSGTCPLCGAFTCERCRATGRHTCVTLGYD